MGGWLRALVRFPIRAYRWAIYDSRPDIVTSKTRAAEWAKLQSPWRWMHALVPYLGPPSFVLWRIQLPLTFNMFMALLVILDSQVHWLGIATIDFSADVVQMWRMTSFVLALLMAFRVNRVYLRWSSGVSAFGGIGTSAVTLAQQAVVWIADERLQDEVVRWAAVWQYSVEQLCSRRERLHDKVACLLGEEELAFYHSVPKPRQTVVLQLRRLVSLAGLNDPKFLIMNDTISKGNADMGICGRLFFYAMPYAITSMCSGFLEIWLLLMPFATVVDGITADTLVEWASVVKDLLLYLLASILMLGVDEVTNQLEQPFNSIPIVDMADATLRAVLRARAETNRCSELTSKRLGYDVSCAHLIERDRDRGRISATAERSDGGGLAFGGGAARKRSAPVEIAVHM